MLNQEDTEAKFIYAFGINHQNANAAIRERVSLTPEEIAASIKNIQTELNLEELVVLSTCNRSEFYALCSSEPNFLAWIAKKKALNLNEYEDLCFKHYDRIAIRHIYRVACGLDSLILGEPQILGQMKKAYKVAKESGTVSSVLDRLFQQAFSVAKQVRHTTAIGKNPVSVAYAGVKLTHQFFNDHPKRCALIVGAGETAKLTAKYLRDSGIGRLIIANRTLSNAQLLAAEMGGFAIALEQIPAHLHEADLIFGTARSDNPLITGCEVGNALKNRKYMQVFIDLAIPRNFSADIDDLDDAFLYGIDDLEQIIEHNVQARKQAAEKAEVMVNLYSDDFYGWFLSKPQQQIVRHMREMADSTRQKLLQDVYRRLAAGEEPAVLMEQLSIKLMNKLLHHPSELIQAIPPDHKDWLAIVADTFHYSD